MHVLDSERVLQGAVPTWTIVVFPCDMTGCNECLPSIRPTITMTAMKKMAKKTARMTVSFSVMPAATVGSGETYFVSVQSYYNRVFFYRDPHLTGFVW